MLLSSSLVVFPHSNCRSHPHFLSSTLPLSRLSTGQILAEDVQVVQKMALLASHWLTHTQTTPTTASRNENTAATVTDAASASTNGTRIYSHL